VREGEGGREREKEEGEKDRERGREREREKEREGGVRDYFEEFSLRVSIRHDQGCVYFT